MNETPHDAGNGSRVPENLRPYCWPRGVSGNPGGRRHGPSVTALLREAIAQEVDGKPAAIHIAEVIVAKARAGDVAFVKELLNRLEGKVPTRFADADGAPFKVYVASEQFDPNEV
jgi:hypothetical protein